MAISTDMQDLNAASLRQGLLEDGVQRSPQNRATKPLVDSEPSIEARELHKDRHPILDFISNPLIHFTTLSSSIINAISAPVRMFDDKNPLKKIINAVSMFFTRLHLGAYAASGMISASEQKNPYLLFSFACEAVAACFGLRKIYLFRGLSTGIDATAAAIKDRFEQTHFKTYADGFKHNNDAMKTIWQEFVAEPSKLLKLKGEHTCLVSSIFVLLGTLLGMSFSDKVGGVMRDIAGGVGDLGIFNLKDKTARNAGVWYIAGTLLDLTARMFNQSLAKVLGIMKLNAFGRLRDFFHELAIAADRWGQYFFLRYNQKTNGDDKKEDRVRLMSKPLLATTAA